MHPLKNVYTPLSGAPKNVLNRAPHLLTPAQRMMEVRSTTKYLDSSLLYDYEFSQTGFSCLRVKPTLCCVAICTRKMGQTSPALGWVCAAK